MSEDRLLAGDDGREAGSGVPARWVVWGTGVAVFLLGLALWRPFPAGIWHDDGVYMMLGRALARGEGLSYLGVSGTPPAPKFPPLYPLTLAGLWSVTTEVGRVVAGARILNLVFLAAGAGIFVRYLDRGLGFGLVPAAAITGMAWLAGGLWRVAAIPLSEPFFVLTLILGLATATAAERRPGRAAPVALFVLSFVAATYVRTAGVALAGAGLLALLFRGRRRAAAAVAGGGAAALLPWVLWSGAAARRIPEPLRDVLGPYGGWLVDQIVGSPGLFLSRLRGEAVDLVHRVLTILVPEVPAWEPWLGDVRWVALAVLVPAFLLGVDRLWARSRVPVLLLLLYLGLVWIWPFRGDRLLIPVAPVLILTVAQGFLWRGEGAERREGDPEIEDVEASGRIVRGWRGAGLAWAAIFVGFSLWGLATGAHVRGYEIRSRALVRAAEAVEEAVPADGVVGAPELWAGLHLHTGRTVAPSARFRPLDPDAPSWGTPEAQLEVWDAAGIEYLLVEHGGRVHRETLDVLAARCGDGTWVILSSWEGAALVHLRWDESCRRDVVGRAPGEAPGPLPVDLALLAGVHVGPLPALQEYLPDLVGEELPGLGRADVQAVVVDQQRLVLEPVGPAVLTDLLVDRPSHVVPERGLRKLRTRLTTPSTFDLIHAVPWS